MLCNKKYSKYKNKKIIWDGKEFDSIKERDYYLKLLDDKKLGKIDNFKWQFPLSFIFNDKKMFTLTIDFLIVINYKSSNFNYIDVKAFDKKTGKYIRTAVFNLKKKLIESQYNIKILLT